MNHSPRADELWSEIIRARDLRCQNPTCNIAGHRTDNQPLPIVGLTAAHIFRRGKLQTRCDLDNGMALCPTCHDRYETDPPAWRKFVIERIGADAYEQLRAKANTLGRPDWDTVIAELRPIHTRLTAAA